MVARAHGSVLVLLMVLLLGCSKASLLESSLENPSERRELLESTLTVFDKHPNYVDELFVLSRAHTPTFNRLVQQAGLALEEPAFAGKVASEFGKHPTAVQVITRAMLIEAKNSPALRSAFAAALYAEGDLMRQVLAEHPELMQRLLTR